jgi:hypothetical protein
MAGESEQGMRKVRHPIVQATDLTSDPEDKTRMSVRVKD